MTDEATAGVQEFITEASVDELNTELEARGISPDAVISILPIENNFLGAAPGPGERFRVLYRVAA